MAVPEFLLNEVKVEIREALTRNEITPYDNVVNIVSDIMFEEYPKIVCVDAAVFKLRTMSTYL